jgi:hypothetical protein
MFVETGLPDGLAVSDTGQTRAGMGLDTADYRNTGTPGLAIGNFNFEGIALYDLNNPPPYPERSRQAGIYTSSYPYVTFGLFFADFDNDGWPDLFAANGHVFDTVSQNNPAETYLQPCLLFRNRGDGTFVDVSQAAGPPITNRCVGRGACRGDFNNDGKEDILLIPNTGSPHLLENVTSIQNHWLLIKLVGVRSNRDGYGATVTVEAGGRRQSAYSHSGSSYLSASDPRLHFGLAGAAEVDRVTVDWPGGLREAWGPLAADRIVTLKEGAGKPL